MAGLSTTQSFADGDTVTAAKLNNIIAGASISNDAVTTAKIDDNAVTLAQMANNSVDTAELVDNAVQNSKLEEMAAKTVKANATNATANPTDVAVAANKLLAGTSNSINAVSFTDDLELDASDSAATKIKAAATLIGGKSSVTADSSDELLIKDATDGALKRATAQSVVSSTAATSSVSGSTELATAAELIGATASPANLVAGVTSAAPMLAKAWGYLKTASSAIVPASSILQNCTVARTGTGAFTVTFATDLPSVKYMVLGNGRSLGASTYGFGLQLVSSNLAVGSFDFLVVDTNDSEGSPLDPDGGVQFVVYGLTS
jgi:hypothetical protein